MKKTARHIVLFFTLVIEFPLVFQPVHILHHHHGDHFCDHSAEQEAHFNHHHETCPICDYEFTIFDLQDENVSTQEQVPLVHFTVYHPEVPFINYTGNSTLLRAPPVAG